MIKSYRIRVFLPLNYPFRVLGRRSKCEGSRFYAYVTPQPEGLMDKSLSPKEAFWDLETGMVLLMYNWIREAEAPEQKVLDFLESVYQAGAKKANLDIGAFRLP